MSGYTESVQKLYVAYFNRPADIFGRDFWQSQLVASGGDLAEVSAAFATSAEYASLYGGMNEDQLVDALYVNLFGRAAEDAGRQFWAQRLRDGSESIGALALTLANSAQGADAITIANKIACATLFDDHLDTIDEILGYSGSAANAKARNWLASVTGAESMAQAVARMDDVIYDIALVGIPSELLQVQGGMAV